MKVRVEERRKEKVKENVKEKVRGRIKVAREKARAVRRGRGTRTIGPGPHIMRRRSQRAEEAAEATTT